jgi:hypothetical protein
MVPEFQPNVSLSKAAFVSDATKLNLDERSSFKFPNGSGLLKNAESN